MNIAVTGASGFIGCRLTARFEAEGHVVRAISLRQPLSEDAFTGCDGVVHLAGESVAQRWSREVKQRILDSRVNGTRSLVEAMRQHPPRVLISASAVGYYGSRGDDILTEEEPPGAEPCNACFGRSAWAPAGVSAAAASGCPGFTSTICAI
jgi:NAD dependent epimerase/dehydratase family enzyme